MTTQKSRYARSVANLLKNDSFLDAVLPDNVRGDTLPQSAFFLRELEDIDAAAYDIKRPKLEALELLNTKPVNPGANEYTFRQFDKRGIAKIISDYQDGFPRADVGGVEFTSKLKSVGLGFGINFQEVRAAIMEGRPLDRMKAEAAQRGIGEKTNSVALLGDTEHGLYGLFNQPDATIVVGTGGWGSATADQILSDMFGLVDSIPTLTKETENPNMLVLPYAKLRFIGTKRLTTTVSDTTVLEFFKKQRPNVEVRGAMKLETASAGGANRMVAYDKNSLFWLVAVPMETLPVRQQGHETVTDYHARVGGVVAPYPLSIAYMDAI